MYDVIIVGKGPAGLSAALYTVRSNLNTLIIGMDNGALNKAGKIENYFGFENPLSGKELIDAGQKQVERLGAKIIQDQVMEIENTENGFKITSANETYESKAVLISTGQTIKNLAIEGIKEFEGKGVSYCTTCDGFFFRGLTVGVIGAGDYALHEAMELLTFTNNITIFTNGNEMNVKENEQLQKFKINNKKIKSFIGDEVLKSIVFEDETTAFVDGVFIAGETASGMDFARKLGVLIEGNTIIVDKDQQTNIAGLFASGDCTSSFKQISVAVGQGALAGRRIIEYLRRKK